MPGDDGLFNILQRDDNLNLAAFNAYCRCPQIEICPACRRLLRTQKLGSDLFSAMLKSTCANNVIAYLHGQHLYRHDSQMFIREERIEGVEEGPDVRLEEELLHFAVAREPIEDEISSEVSRCQPTIHVICKIHLT